MTRITTVVNVDARSASAAEAAARSALNVGNDTASVREVTPGQLYEVTFRAHTYDRARFRDKLFPEGRPPCIECRILPVYLAGRCGPCYRKAATPPMTEAESRAAWGDR
jgi:hypothetical protein